MAVQAQPYSENLVGLSLCGLQQDWMDFGGGSGSGDANGGCGFYEFYPQVQQVQQLQVNHQMAMQNHWMMRNQNLGQVVDPSENVSSMGFYQTLGVQLEKQRQEIDRFISVQNERLRSGLQQQRKQQLSVLLTQLETKALNLLLQKDADIAKATRKTMELEECIRRAEMEKQVWQRVAKENESMVEQLSNTLEKARENACILASEAEDAESCCQSRTEEDEEGKEQQKSSIQAMKMVCKTCNSGDLCVLFLPCRHLCCCKTCAPFLGSCPVCQSVKKACIEVFIA